MNKAQNIRINKWKYKAVEYLEISTGKVSTSSFYFYVHLQS